MTERSYRSPDFYESEIDLSVRRPRAATGTPAAVVGTSLKGPAFVPVSVGNEDEFVNLFGPIDKTAAATYAAQQFLQYRPALTFERVLGAGANQLSADIQRTLLTGQVKSAGFVVTGTLASGEGRHHGAVQMLVANHTFTANESLGYPLFTDNDTFGASTGRLVRGVLLFASGARARVLDGNESAVGAFVAGLDDAATLSSGLFKLAISSSLGSVFGSTDGQAGVRIFSASLDPSSRDYYTKILNTNPDRFVEEQHLVYLDFPVDAELAVATTVGIVSGSSSASLTSGDTSMTFRDAYGHFDTRYSRAKSPWVISQPFGNIEHDLMRFEALDDGVYGNDQVKISISNVRRSADDANQYGTFTVVVRSWDDTDDNQIVLEQYPNCNLNPQSENFVAAKIGDRKKFFNFDETVDAERRMMTEGKYKNQSKYVRVVVSDAVDRGVVPQQSLPFGFRGYSVLKTSDISTDIGLSTARITGVGVGDLSGSVVPPVPFRFKVTIGDSPSSAAFPGAPGASEVTNASLSWGVKFDRNTDPLNPNVGGQPNEFVRTLTKLEGIEKLDTTVTGTLADQLCGNKFSLARVALPITSVADLTSSVDVTMRAAAYLRDGVVNPTDYSINDGALGSRVTFGTLAAMTSSVEYNRFAPFAKFTFMLSGGWDGTNLLDKNARKMNDKSSSFESGGGAEANFVSPGLAYNCSGVGADNATVQSYITAVKLATDPMQANANLITVPGIREPYITDKILQYTKDYALAMAVIDIPSYDEDGTRVFDDSSTKPDVDETAKAFDSRALDNSYSAAYFPDVTIDDRKAKRRVKLPASVAAYAALALNDKLAHPWFAPAGFNRAALDFVTNTAVRLNTSDRNRLQDARINPIASFPNVGYVVYGQKTLQLRASDLDRVNVRRMMLEVRRVVSRAAGGLVFEQSDPAYWDQFKGKASTELGLIQLRSGIKAFRIVMDETNNTSEDIDLNRVNGSVRIVPVKSAEFIAVDFVITNSGLEFV